MKPLKQPGDIRDLVTSFRYSAVLTAAFELGVFAAIATRGPSTLPELSENCESHPRSLAMLLNSCVAMGLLSLEPEDRYELTPLSKEALAPGSPHYLGNFIRLQHDVQARWALLRDGIEYDRRVNPETKGREDGSQWEWNHRFIHGLHDTARLASGPVAETLKPYFEKNNITSVVDVGAGSGDYSAALAELLPQVQVKLLDLAGPLSVTAEILSSHPARARLELVNCNFHQQALGEENEYDAALLFGVLHSEPTAGQAELLSKVCQVLKPGGLLVLRTSFLNPDKAGPLPATLDSLQTLISTDRGEVLAYPELKKLLSHTGFRDVKILRVPKTGVKLVLATRTRRAVKV